jgi:NADP-dependent 3-hydroxy acid dehydrogenase YdfG
VAKVMNKDGHIFGITSAVLDQVDPRVDPYWIAKMAQRDYLRVLQKEVGSRIHIHEIVPGFMAGGLNSDLPAATRDMAAKKGEKVSTLEEVTQEILSKLSR